MNAVIIFSLVWCQALHPAGRHASSCLSYGGQPVFSSQDACEAYAAPLRRRIAAGRKGSIATIECIARTVLRPVERLMSDPAGLSLNGPF